MHNYAGYLPHILSSVNKYEWKSHTDTPGLDYVQTISYDFSWGPERTKFFRAGEIFFGLKLCICYKDTMTVLPAQSQDNSGLHQGFSAFFPTADNVASLCSPLTLCTHCTHSCSTSEDICQGTSHNLSLIIHSFLHSDTSLTHLCSACLLFSTTMYLRQTKDL